ncbi:hypothetical protein RA25_13705 [Leisingera sp. ANG-S5]|nr:hypothetical protein RA25_13705 [Leisingera sp. ANG-S5]
MMWRLSGFALIIDVGPRLYEHPNLHLAKSAATKPQKTPPRELSTFILYKEATKHRLHMFSTRFFQMRWQGFPIFNMVMSPSFTRRHGLATYSLTPQQIAVLRPFGQIIRRFIRVQVV